MKILRLSLENFAPIWSKLNKSKIDLDFSKTKNIINVIIGEMGSCKTMILGHLQPFASFGNIDIRNGDDLIIEGEHGKKVIIIQDGNNIYSIKHDYIPKDSKHTIKSFIKKNDLELNPNGNQSSFKEIIELEFGIDISYLTLVRLGANVQNIINLSSTERKKFIGDKLSEVEFYNLLLKDLKEENRRMNAHIDILTGKLSSLQSNKYNDYVGDLSRLNAAKAEEDEILRKYTDTFFNLKNRAATMLQNLSIEDFRYKIQTNEETISRITSEYTDTLTQLNKIKNFDIEKAKEEIILYERMIPMITEDINALSEEYKSKDDKLLKLKDKLAMVQDSEHLDLLNDQMSSMVTTMNNLKSRFNGVKLRDDVSTTLLKKDLSDTMVFSEMLMSLTGYDVDSLLTAYNSDSSILQYSRKKIEILERTKLKYQRSLANLQFNNTYEPDRVVFFPPGCPTHDCPYYQTHPMKLKKEDHVDFKKAISDTRAKMDEIDREIETYMGYPTLYKTMNSIKVYWRELSKTLKRYGVLLEDDLKVIITQQKTWYNYDKFINIIEIYENYQLYQEYAAKYQSLQTEYNQYKSSNVEDIIRSIDAIEESKRITYETLSNKKATLADYNAKYEEVNELYSRVTEIEKLESDANELLETIKAMEEEVKSMKKILPTVEKMYEEIYDLDNKIKASQLEIRNLNNEINRMTILISDIDSTRSDFEEISEQQSYIKYMIKASSSKEGLPLILIKRFIDSTRDIINDLLSNVFGESVEILDFEIDETTFNIPYSVNGTYVEDINRASQGQQSIISLALSFALMQKFMTKFNIPLLDEIDGPLYKDDRNKFIEILFRQIDAIHAEQVFLITHNNTFDGYPVNVIMTTDEVVDNELVNVIHV